ncbi:hypothetical protein C8R43DRAFT_1027998 [Mycena crocata]|nr:hypothetical protein C8R43DRAFT_1027998 [Mycena crocata]
MRFISAIYVTSALLLAGSAAPILESLPVSSLVSRAGEDITPAILGRNDIFLELDLTARQDEDIEKFKHLIHGGEAVADRNSQTSGCIVA